MGSSGSGTSRVVAGSETTFTVVNSAAETDLFSYTIPGGSLRAGDRLRLWIAYDMLNNSGGSLTFQPKFYVGATALLSGTAVTLSTSATRRSGVGQFVLTCVGAAAQKMSGQMVAATGAGFPGQTTAPITWTGNGVEGTEDTSSDKVFKMTITISGANAAADFRLSSYLLEKIPVAG